MFFDKQSRHRILLIDPDKVEAGFYDELEHKTRHFRPDMFFVGGSFSAGGDTGATVSELKSKTSKPVILFPGDYAQLTPRADAVLFLNLLSGRNPEYLAGQQVKAAPVIRRLGLPVIPTAYLLVDGGTLTTVQYITQTLPIPADKIDLAVATALAGQYMGMQLVYLEAGSGARRPVSLQMLSAVARAVQIPVIVGGGIRDLDAVETYLDAGANGVVIGTMFEKKGRP